jgi:hypothetical protein
MGAEGYPAALFFFLPQILTIVAAGLTVNPTYDLIISKRNRFSLGA